MVDDSSSTDLAAEPAGATARDTLARVVAGALVALAMIHGSVGLIVRLTEDMDAHTFAAMLTMLALPVTVLALGGLGWLGRRC